MNAASNARMPVMVGSIAVTSSVRSLVAVADEADLVEAISLIVRNRTCGLRLSIPGWL
jgi:hypothetical protein